MTDEQLDAIGRRVLEAVASGAAAVLTPAEAAALLIEVQTRRLAREVAGIVAPEKTPGKPRAAAPPPGASREARPTGRTPNQLAGSCRDMRHERRRAVARLLLARPMTGPELFEAANIPLGSSGGLLTHPWFEKESDQRGANWRLTEAGRTALATPPPSGPQADAAA